MSSGFMLRAMRLAGRDELRLSGRIEGRWRVRERGDAPPSGGRRLLNQIRGALLDRLLADTRTAFFGLCLDAGQQVLRTMMEQDRERLCGRKHVPNPARRARRGGSTRGEVTLGGRRLLVPRLRARSVEGHELALPSFAY